MKPTQSRLIVDKSGEVNARSVSRGRGRNQKSLSKNEGEMAASGIYDVRFKRKDLRQFSLNNYVTAGITIDDVKDLKQIFDCYDSTGKGVLLPNDMILLLSQNGYVPTKKTVYEIMAQHDQQQTGGISFDEFMKAMNPRNREMDTARAVQHIFKVYDRKGKGYITLDDLKSVSRQLGEKDDEEMLTLMIDRASKSQAKKITYKEFLEIMNKTVE